MLADPSAFHNKQNAEIPQGIGRLRWWRWGTRTPDPLHAKQVDRSQRHLRYQAFSPIKPAFCPFFPSRAAGKESCLLRIFRLVATIEAAKLRAASRKMPLLAGPACRRKRICHSQATAFGAGERLKIRSPYARRRGLFVMSLSCVRYPFGRGRTRRRSCFGGAGRCASSRCTLAVACHQGTTRKSHRARSVVRRPEDDAAVPT